MADLAVIGFSADTSGLEKGTRELDRINKAAIALTTSEKKLARATEAASASRANAALKAAKAEDSLAAASLRKLKASGSASKAELDAAMALRRSTLAKVEAAQKSAGLVQKLNSESEAMRRNAAAAQEQYNALLGVNRARKSARMSASVFSNAPEANVPRDMMPNRFNTANIAAQFQDIGVTAAMGMNPLIIALQQGTQTAAIANSMMGPNGGTATMLRGLRDAFLQIINPVSLVTIGLVGLVAAGLQMVDWSSTAQSALNGLADVIENSTPVILGMVGALALFYSGAILGGIKAVTVSIVTMGSAAVVAGGKMLAAWFMALSPLQMIVLGIAALTTVFQMLGVDVLGTMKKIGNGLINGFVGAFEAIKAVWGLLPAAIGDLTTQAVNWYLRKISDMVNGTVEMINVIIRAAGGTEIQFKADLQIDNDFEGKAAAAAKVAGDAFNKELSVDRVGQGLDYISEKASQVSDKIRNMAKGIGQGSDDIAGGKSGSHKDPWAELNQSARQRIENLKMEQAALGMSERAAAKMRYEQEMLNEAVQKGIDLLPRQRAEIAAMADEMATIEDQTRSTKEAMDFLRDGTKGFFQDLKQGLQEGKSLWESFGNAVLNVLNKIMDRMLTSGAEAIFDGLFGNGGGGASSVVGDLASFLFSANGNAFAASGRIEPFAKGGAFTNSIVDRATPFMFANGGKFGVMGEKGAEAVMPLHRGSDGSLGVKVSGGTGGSTAVVLNINNFGNSTVSTQQRETANGIELDVMIDEMVAQKISDQSSSTNRSLKTRDSRRIISR